MAKASRGRARQVARRKAPAPTKRKTAKPSVASDKIRALVYNLSAQELEELIKVATGRKNEEMASARASFLDEVTARAATLGMSLADLVGLGAGKATGSSKGSVQTPGAKYRNPKTGETWSGRGRPAKWITEVEAKGRRREDFMV
jgi:DNA-binding protein H-NS